LFITTSFHRNLRARLLGPTPIKGKPRARRRMPQRRAPRLPQARQAATRPLPQEKSMPDSTLVTGLFRDRDSAERAYRAVAERGYSRDDIAVVMSEETRRQHFANAAPTELGSKAAEGAGIGGAIGGTVGAIAAAVAAIGTSIAIPGLGLVVAGPVAAALAGAGAGAATGGLVGALIGWGIPEERVRRYEAGVREGGILMGVKPRSEADAAYFEDLWNRSRGE
jgi:hypothetical protein